MTRTKHTTPYYTKQRVFFAVFAGLFILFGFYIYFVSASVVQVIARKEVEGEIIEVQSTIGDLESTYLATKNSISGDTLASFGFVVIAPRKIFIEKKSTNLVLVTHDEN